MIQRFWASLGPDRFHPTRTLDAFCRIGSLASRPRIRQARGPFREGIPMASKAKIAQNEYRKKMTAKYAGLRAELKEIIRSPKSSDEEKLEAQEKLQKLPRNSTPVRIRNRCAVTGRPRAYYRKFGLSRIALRELGHRGEVPGLTKSSW